MAVTAHFINAEGVLAEHLIAFRRLKGSHSGANIGQNLFSVFEENGITNKIGFVTLDNASNNDTLMQELEQSFRAHNIETFGHESNRIRCFPHVINLAVRALLGSLAETAKHYREAAAAQSIPIDAQTEEYLRVLESKPVDGCRNLVNTMRKSDGRREGLQESIEHGNLHNLFVNGLGEFIEVPALQLLRDSETRWSSTYNMICRFLQLNPAIMHYSAQNPALKLSPLSRRQIEVLRDISSILFVLNNAQELLSAERTPTLALALPVYESLIHTLADLRPQFPELGYAITCAINKLEYYVNKTHHIPVYALSMVVNPCFKLKWIDTHWDSPARAQAYAIVREQMLRYHRQHPNNAFDVPTPANAAARALGSGFARLLTGGLTITRASNMLAQPHNNPYISHPPPPLFNPIPTTPPPQDPMIAVDSELARWIGEGTLETSKMGSIELAQYWNMRRLEFPLLYRIAMDVLPAQASSVSCERAFSASKLTITRERNLILPENLEMLQFLKHSLHRRHRSSGLETQPLDFMAHIVRPDLDSDTGPDSEYEESDTEYESD